MSSYILSIFISYIYLQYRSIGKSPHVAHYSKQQPLGASPSFGVFDNALPADSLTLYMAPGRGCWLTSPGQPYALPLMKAQGVLLLRDGGLSENG